MPVLVDQAGVVVGVAVRLGRGAGGMRVLMVLVVGVQVVVVEFVMGMGMDVALGQMEIEAERHQQAAGDEGQGQLFAQEQDRDGGADEGCARVIGASARGAEMAQGQHEQSQRDAVAEEAEQPGERHRTERRKRGARAESDRGVDGAGDQALQHRDNDGIGAGDLAGQVVVDRPGEAGARHQQSRAQCARCGFVRPGEDDGAGDNRGGTDQKAGVHVLAEHDPGEDEGQHAFEIEQQRGRAGRTLCQAEHQQHRADHAAAENRRAEPGEIGTLQLRLVTRQEGARDGETDAGAEIEQAREQPG